MTATLEDLDRRVTALERAAEREQTLERAVAEVVSESERRVRAEMSKLRGEMSELRTELREEMSELRAETARLANVMSASERRFVDLLNDRFDQVMTALDRPKD
jgi:hypothetical protein